MATRTETASQTAAEALKTTNFTNERDSVVVVERDTVREVTVVTVDRNERGDTVRIATVTDREKMRDRNQIAVERTKKEVVRDTVYIERRDSSFVSTTDVTDVTDGGGGFRSTLKWIFWIIIGLIGLVVTLKVCLLKR